MYAIKLLIVVIFNDKNPKIGVYINFNKLLLYRYYINAKNPKIGLIAIDQFNWVLLPCKARK